MGVQQFGQPGEPDELSPAARLLLVILLNSNKQGVERIHFERFIEPNEEGRMLSCSCEKDGTCKEFEVDGFSLEDVGKQMTIPPLELWQKVIRRLKVMARVVDDGSTKSVDGQIFLHLAKNCSVEFHMTTNPNPHSDNKVTLVNKGPHFL